MTVRLSLGKFGNEKSCLGIHGEAWRLDLCMATLLCIVPTLEGFGRLFGET